MNIRAVVHLLVALAAMPLAAATEPTYVQLLTTAEYQLTGKVDGSLSAHATVETAKDVDVSKLTVNVVDVSEKNLSRPDVRDVMIVKFIDARTMSISIPASVNLKPATYNVTLFLQPALPPKPAQNAPPQPPRQKLPLQLIRPAADVSTVTSATIKRTRISPFGADLVVAPSIQLREKSGRTDLTGVGADVETVQHDDEAIPGTVDLDFSAFDAQHRRSTGTFHLSGEFPIGTSTTKAVIDSPQLAAPLSVIVQIKTQRHRGFLLGAIVLGLLAGYLVRVLLAASITRNEARLQAIDLLARMDAEVARRRDATFMARVTSAAQTLKNALRRSAVALSAEITAAETELRAALDDLNQRKVLQLQDLDALMATLGTEWHLPPKLAAIVAAAQQRAAAARLSALGDDVDGAKTVAAQIRTDLARDVEAAMQEWATSTRTELDALTDGLRPLSKTFQDTLIAAIGAAVSKLDAVESMPLGIPADLLSAVHVAARGIRWSVNRPLEQVGAQAKEAINILTAASLPRAKEAAAALSIYLLAVRSEQPFAEVAKQLTALLKTLREIISDAAGGSAAVVAELDAGEYVKAAEKATSPVPSQGTRLALTRSTSAAKTAGLSTEAAPADVLISRTFTTAFAAETIVPLEVLQVRSAVDLFVAKLLRFVLSGIGIAIVGFLLLESKFVGTPSDLATAFFWGYAADLGVDALTTAAAKVGR